MIEIEWKIKTFKQLDTDELYELLRLRVDVFVVEQNCPYPEIDGKDSHPETLHLWDHLVKEQELRNWPFLDHHGMSYMTDYIVSYHHLPYFQIQKG